MAVKKKVKLSLFQIWLHRGKLAPSLIGTKAAKDGDSAISAFLETGMGVPGNAGKLDCGHESISVEYEAVKVA